MNFGDELRAPVGPKHYEWQVFVGNTWLRLENDHVIETHYCQPGAKGISINTSHGRLSIDFDTYHTQSGPLRVQRLVFSPTEDIGWYYRDDQLWREYGFQNSNMAASSISSTDVESQFTQNPQASFRFNVGSTGYRLDFSTMSQINCVTGMSRNVRRRPKFTSDAARGGASASIPQLSDGGYKWEFMGDEGQWTEYDANLCSFDSAAIERQYQLSPQSKLQLKTRKFTYTLDFLGMQQTNDRVGTIRAVRRTADDGSGQSSSGASLPRWQFQDDNETWKDFSNATCRDIERQYQQNPSGTVNFRTNAFRYELNLSAMTQRNLQTHTVRSVRRL